MADLRYQVQVDTAQAQRGLTNLRTSTNSVNTAMLGLRSALGALAIGAFVRNAGRAANAITDLSAATGVSIQTIQGLSEAFGRNGGSARVAQDAIVRVTRSISTAAGGSRSLTEAFDRVGVSLQDIDTLSESDILRKTIEGLGRLPDAADRSRLSMELLGRSVATVDFAGLSRDQDRYIAGAAGSAQAIEAAGRANQNFANAVQVLQIEVLKALEPVSQLAVRMTASTDAIGRFVEIVKNVAIVLGSFLLLTRAVTVLRAGLVLLTGSGAAIAAAFGSIVGTVTRVFSQFRAVAREGAITSRTINGLATRFKFLGEAAKLLRPAIAPVLGALTALASVVFPDQVRAAFSRLKDMIFGTSAALADAAEQQKKADAAAAEAEATRNRLAAAQAALTRSIAEGNRVLREAAEAYQLQARGIENSIALQSQLLGAGEQQVRLSEALRQAETAYLSEVTRLQSELAKAKRSSSEAERAQIDLLLSQLAQLDRAYRDNQSTIRELVQEHESLVRARNLDTFATQQQQIAQDRLTQLQREMARMSMSEIERKYFDIANAADDAARAAIRAEEARRGSPLTLAEQEEYYRRAREGNNALILQTRRLFDQNERIRRQAQTFGAGWSRAFREYRDAARDSSQLAESLFRTATRGMEDAIVDFAKTGKFNFRDLVADMSEQLLRSQIQKTIGSLGDALGLGNLFGGGSGGASRGSSANNPLFVQDVSGGGGAGGALRGALGGQPGQPGLLQRAGSAIGGLFGGKTAADGTKQPGLLSRAGSAIGRVFGGSRPTDGVGPTQPGLLSRAGSAIGRVFSGGRPGGDQQPSLLQRAGSAIGSLFGGSQPTRTPGINPAANKSGGGFLSSLASGAKSLFKGFFANGGVIPAGKFGMVGERGPELISGPAGITPLSSMGGTTNVTYNISAVDAPSFQALVARDPGFIHAVAQQGARGMPIGRR